jgi:hypothetical protein
MRDPSKGTASVSTKDGQDPDTKPCLPFPGSGNLMTGLDLESARSLILNTQTDAVLRMGIIKETCPKDSSQADID